jgi:DNA-binding transcriptional LysR family regulator
MDEGGIDLNLLRVMQVVDQEGSVTRAARRLGLSQPAVSNALARLRRSMGDPMFVRSTMGMEATPRARRVLDALDAAMGLIRLGLRDATQFDPASTEEEFGLLITDLGEARYLPRLMGHLAVHAPRARIRVRQLASSAYAEALETGLADLAVGYLPHPRSSLRSRRLFTDSFVCVLRQGHPAAAKGALTLDRFSALSHVAVSRHGGREGLVSEALEGLGIRRNVALVVPHFAAAALVVAATDLAAVMPTEVMELSAASGLTSTPLPFAVPRIDVALYWHERLQEDAASRWLRSVFVTLFARPDTTL